MKARLLRAFHIGVISVSLGVLAWTSYKVVHYLRNAPRFEVKALEVSGVAGPLKRVSEDQIIAQAEFAGGTNVFRADLSQIRERVERLQWVRHAIVQRVLPDQIIIRVVEREPIGIGRIGGEVYQFDVDAAILEMDAISTASFPVLDGLRRGDAEGNVRKVEIYRHVLEELGQTELSEVHINSADEVSVVSVSDSMVVTLGLTELRNRWIKYLQLRPQIQQEYKTAVKIDMRFKNQVIVRMKDDDTNEQVIWGVEKKTL